jgi:predicted nucleic acid-binding protein
MLHVNTFSVESRQKTYEFSLFSQVSLAMTHGLSAYDATYLHLAMITGDPLATLDRALITAAKKVGVDCL